LGVLVTGLVFGLNGCFDREKTEKNVQKVQSNKTVETPSVVALKFMNGLKDINYDVVKECVTKETLADGTNGIIMLASFRVQTQMLENYLKKLNTFKKESVEARALALSEGKEVVIHALKELRKLSPNKSISAYTVKSEMPIENNFYQIVVNNENDTRTIYLKKYNDSWKVVFGSEAKLIEKKAKAIETKKLQEQRTLTVGDKIKLGNVEVKVNSIKISKFETKRYGRLDGKVLCIYLDVKNISKGQLIKPITDKSFYVDEFGNESRDMLGDYDGYTSSKYELFKYYTDLKPSKEFKNVCYPFELPKVENAQNFLATIRIRTDNKYNDEKFFVKFKKSDFKKDTHVAK